MPPSRRWGRQPDRSCLSPTSRGAAQASAAHNIIAQTGADAFRIERETPYSTNYSEVAYGDAKTEADTNARPPIKNPPASLAEYDKSILCYSIWLAYHNLIFFQMKLRIRVLNKIEYL